MEWYYAVKIAAKSLFDSNTRKVIIGIAIAIPLIIIIPFTIPVMLLSLPQSSFSDTTEEENKIIDTYRQYLVEYKSIVHDNIKKARSDFRKDGKTVKEVQINYPSLSVIMAYENVIHKDRYTSSKNSKPISKDEIFKFLDSCMSYELEGEVVVAKVKSPEDVGKFFTDSDDRNMFELIYMTLLTTDLDNTVPEVEFVDFDYNEAVAEIPYYNQYDPRWRNLPYGDSTIGVSGCGVTSMAMILTGLFPSTPVYPPEIANWSATNGYYVSGVGTAWSLFPALAQKYDLNMKIMSRNNPQEILDTLASGTPVVVSMSAGHFTRGGHFIVLKGIDSDGKIIVNDCGSYQNTEVTWDFSIILAESSTLSPSCFWSFTKK